MKSVLVRISEISSTIVQTLQYWTHKMRNWVIMNWNVNEKWEQLKWFRWHAGTAQRFCAGLGCGDYSRWCVYTRLKGDPSEPPWYAGWSPQSQGPEYVSTEHIVHDGSSETNLRIDCIEDSVQPNKTLGNISLQFLSNDCSGRQGHQRWNIWKVCRVVANEDGIEEFGWMRRVQPLTTLAYAT